MSIKAGIFKRSRRDLRTLTTLFEHEGWAVLAKMAEEEIDRIHIAMEQGERSQREEDKDRGDIESLRSLIQLPKGVAELMKQKKPLTTDEDDL